VLHVFRRFVPATTYASLVGIAACSGASSLSSGVAGSAATAPPLVTASFSFPAGDATSAPGGTAWDIVGVKTTLSGTPGSPAGNRYDTLRVDVTFVQDVRNALPAPGQSLLSGNELGVGIALDADANPNTGSYGTCTLSNPLRPFEYFSDPGTDPGRLPDGNYGIVDPNGNLVYSGSSNPAGEAVTTVSQHVLTQSFYLPSVDVFGGAAVPNIGVAVAAHNGAGALPTDCVPRSTPSEVFTI
jgi:hypothetical protein